MLLAIAPVLSTLLADARAVLQATVVSVAAIVLTVGCGAGQALGTRAEPLPEWLTGTWWNSQGSYGVISIVSQVEALQQSLNHDEVRLHAQEIVIHSMPFSRTTREAERSLLAFPCWSKYGEAVWLWWPRDIWLSPSERGPLEDPVPAVKVTLSTRGELHMELLVPEDLGGSFAVALEADRAGRLGTVFKGRRLTIEDAAAQLVYALDKLERLERESESLRMEIYEHVREYH